MLGWIGLAGLAFFGATQTAAQKKATAAAKKAAAAQAAAVKKAATIQKQLTAAVAKGNTAAVSRLTTQLQKVAPTMVKRDITAPVTDANGTVCDATQIDPNTNLCMVGAPQAGGNAGASALNSAQQKKIVANANKMIKQINAKMNDLNTYAAQGRIDPNIAQQYAQYLQCLQTQVVNVATQCQAPGTTIAQLTQMINKAKQAVKKGTPPSFAPGMPAFGAGAGLDASGQPCPPGTWPDINGVCQSTAIAPPGGVDTTTPTDGLYVTGPQGTFEAGSPIDGSQDNGVIYEDMGAGGAQYIQSPYQNEYFGPSSPTPIVGAPYPGYAGMPNTQLPYQQQGLTLQPLPTDTKACTAAKTAYQKQMTNLQTRLGKAKNATQQNNIIKQIQKAQTNLMARITKQCVTNAPLPYPGGIPGLPGYPGIPGLPGYPGVGASCPPGSVTPPAYPGTYSGQTVQVNSLTCGIVSFTWNGSYWQQQQVYPGSGGPLQVGGPCSSTTGAQGWFDGYTCKTIDQIPDAVPGFTQSGQLARKNVGYSSANANQYGIPPTYFAGAYYIVGVWNGSQVVPVGASGQPGSCPPGFAFNGYQCNPIGGGVYSSGYGGGDGGGGYGGPTIYSDDGSAAGLDSGALVVTGGGPSDYGYAGGDVFDDSGVAFNQGDAVPGQAILGPVRAPMEQAVIAQANRVTPPSTESTDILDTSTASSDASRQYPGVGDENDDFASTNDLDDVSGGDSGAGGDLTITDWSDTDSQSDDDFGFAGFGAPHPAHLPPVNRHGKRMGFFGTPRGQRPATGMRPARGARPHPTVRPGTRTTGTRPINRAPRQPGTRRNRLLKGLPLIAMY